MHFVAAHTGARTERFHGPEDIVLEPPPALEIRLLSPQILEELPDERAHRRVQLGRLDASPAINIFRYRDRNIFHRYTIIQSHRSPEERAAPFVLAGVARSAATVPLMGSAGFASCPRGVPEIPVRLKSHPKLWRRLEKPGQP
jgi:hypothetical protein